jgi:hypothetical protein
MAGIRNACKAFENAGNSALDRALSECSGGQNADSAYKKAQNSISQAQTAYLGVKTNLENVSVASSVESFNASFKKISSDFSAEVQSQIQKYKDL